MTTASIDIVPLPQAIFGKTGEHVPLLGLGTAPGGFGLADADAIALFERAIDLGVTYIDTAPGYERAQSQLAHIVPHCRGELFLVSKAHTAHYQEALDIVEKTLETLGTDHLDLVYVHSLGHLDVEQVLAKDGALAGLREAQRRGWTRYIGITAHHAPWKSAKVLREVEIDACMFALSFVDCHIYNFEEVVLPLARAQNAGVAAMKVYGGTIGMDYHKPRPSELANSGFDDHERALRYALGLPGVSLAVIGVYNEEELVQNIEWMRRYTPLDAGEQQTLLALGRGFARQWGPHYGPVE
ncbi:MAG: aldo/keto reductase [Gemmatimonadetes bacterium]|nr:aldo/keto reductase [Gemmatimonadota bacterium]